MATADGPAQKPQDGGKDKEGDADADPIGGRVVKQLGGPREGQQEATIGPEHVAAHCQVQFRIEEEHHDGAQERSDQQEGCQASHG